MATTPRRWIPRGPVTEWHRLSFRAASALPPPLDGEAVSLYGYGRLALRDGLRCLGLRAGDGVLVPSVLCRSALLPFEALGLEVDSYDVDEALRPCLRHAESLLGPRTRAVMLVHYFGYPQDPEPMLEFARTRGLALIEDNTHGFLSRRGDRYLGTFGDIAVFSFRKTLAVPNGAALVLNRRDLTLPAPVSRGVPVRELLTFAVRDGVRRLETLLHRDIVGRRREVDGDEESSDGSGVPDRFDVAYSRLADALLRRTDMERVQRTRRESCQYWLAHADRWTRDGARPVFSDLPDGVVPWGLPVWVRDRRAFLAAMRELGVACFTWPDRPLPPPLESLAVIPLHRHPLGDPT